MRMKLTSGLVMLACTGLIASMAAAAPRQVVVVVAEGLNTQTIAFGSGYVKTAFEGGTVALDDLKAQGKTQPADANALAGLKGLLKKAGASGYKTGLVTTADVTAPAALLYDLPMGDGPATAQTLVNSTAFDFIGGGGRANFVPQDVAGSARKDGTDLGKALTAAGGTALLDVESVEAIDREIKGKVLALQGDAPLSYALDRDAGKEAALGDLVHLALQTLGKDNAPFVLVVHDTLLQKALAARDTPALLQQFREIDGVISDVKAARDDQPGLALAVLTTGAGTTPQFTTNVPKEQTDAFYILSELPVSYGGANAALAHPTEESITAFAKEQYKGWQISAQNRAAVLAGTMTPEAAVRASYEPALKIGYTPVMAQGQWLTLGLEGGDPAQALQAWAAQPAGK